MRAIGRSMIVHAYRQLKPWLERIEQQHAAQENYSLAPGLFYLSGFINRLGDEITRSQRYRREFGLVVFQVPVLPERKRRELEIALRDCLRHADVPARLADGVLAVLLPETGEGAATAAERISELLARVAGCPVTTGIARFPADGPKGSDLLRLATERSGSAIAPFPAL